MVDKDFNSEKDFISYLDDDDSIKNQHVIIIKKTDFGVKFKFNPNEDKTIFIPWHRVLKIKEKGSSSGNRGVEK